MEKTTRQRAAHIAFLVVGISVIVAMTLYRPTWPQELWLKTTTRTIQFQFSAQGMCGARDAYQADEISLSDDRRTVIVFASLNCADKPSQPSASERSGAVFVGVNAVPVDPTSDLAAACHCSNKVSFRLENPIDSGQSVVFSSNGLEKARLVAP